MRLIIISLVMFLWSCGSQQPVPVDRYYRLPEINPASVQQVSLSDGVIYVSVFETDGLHRERALIYSDSREGLELKQYHYHHWIDSPTRMIRDHLVEFLRAASAAPTIVSSVDPYPQIEIRGKIKRFDQIKNGSGTEVIVVLELRADKEGRLVHIGDYILTEKVPGDTFPESIAAFNRALINCFTQFVNDVKTAL
ncbi:MAG: ABC-type transport auxiliary lipoprotein family protein [Gammaproteobacteria bacterium]|nr:ABC-type transport auxiliary lipoprotein family protein [Gammaproteobacteria bacterium]